MPDHRAAVGADTASIRTDNTIIATNSLVGGKPEVVQKRARV